MAESALVSPAWVETKLGISRQTRLDLEQRGVLDVVRLTPTSHRRYRRAQIDALAEGAGRPSHLPADPPPPAGSPAGEASPSASPAHPAEG